LAGISSLLGQIPNEIAPLLTDPFVKALLVILAAHLVLPGRTSEKLPAQEQAHPLS
jgi:hypothetical protein